MTKKDMLENFKRVLCLGAHADDIEIGCGGTIHRICQLNPKAEIVYCLFSGDEQRTAEAKNAIQSLAPKHRVDIHSVGIADTEFPYSLAEIKRHLRSIARDFNPDVVFTHQLNDRHQDHATLANATWNVFRSHLIWEYEIPKYEGDWPQVNVLVSLSEANVQAKLKAIEAFVSQHEKSYFAGDLFESLMRVRGIETFERKGFAEGFICRKWTI